MMVVPYYPLSDALIQAIAQLQLQRVAARVRAQHGVPLHYDDAVVALIASRCTERQSGARLVEAEISHSLLPKLSEAFIGRLISGEPLQRIDVAAHSGELVCQFQ
jgi:type VI secretion system protein VasG